MFALEVFDLALSLIVGIGVYLFLSHRRWRWHITAGCLSAAGLYLAFDWGSFHGAISPTTGGRVTSWIYALKSWVMDTSQAADVTVMAISGPFQWKWFLFGHGMDTFLPLFPVYKHDINPFPQAHNSWIQFLWEIGLFGFSLIALYSVSLMKRLYESGRNDLIGGLSCIGTNMFFAFPDRMTQAVLMMIAYLAFCENAVRFNSTNRR